jgi:hypothetical protein
MQLSPHAVTQSYDNAWEICVKPVNSHDSMRFPGVSIGNGKIGLRIATDRIGAETSTIATTTGPVDAFNACSFTLETSTADRYVLQLEQQSLDMFSGIARSLFDANNAFQGIAVEVETYAVKQMPYTHVQTITLTPKTDVALVVLNHEVAGAPQFDKVGYNNNTVFNPNRRNSKPMYILTGKAKIKKRAKLAVCCSYDSPSPKVAIMGFSVGSPRECVQRIHFYDLKANEPCTIHVVTTQLTTHDCGDPVEEAKRIHLNLFSAASPAVARLRSNHIKAWSNVWKHNIIVEPFPSASIVDKENVSRLNMVLRLCLFNMWCSVSDTAGCTSCAPLLAEDDSSELWVMPLVIMWRPNVAKHILERRYTALNEAIRLAASYGCEGCKFPHATEGLWDATGLMHVYNTALIAIHVWNYYRVTLDKNWLAAKGYAIMRNCADFLQSRTEDAFTNMPSVMGIGKQERDNNTMTNALAIAATRYAIEASYELGLPTSPAWHNTVKHLMLPSETKTGALMANGDKKEDFEIYDHLIPLLPVYSEVYFRRTSSLSSRPNDAIKANISYTTSNAAASTSDNVFNTIILSWLKGVTGTLTQSEMDDMVDKATNGAWDVFDNNLSTSAMFVLMVLTSMGTARIVGSVTETRFYSERMGVKVSPSHSMPRAWKGIKIDGLGSSAAAPQPSFYVLNSAA